MDGAITEEKNISPSFRLFSRKHAYAKILNVGEKRRLVREKRGAKQVAIRSRYTLLDGLVEGRWRRSFLDILGRVFPSPI